jgi:hypothetical protein
MLWKNVKIGTVVKPKGLCNYIGYIYKIDESDKSVKVDWSISLSEWEDHKDLEEIEICNEDFFKNLLETLELN